MITLQIFKTPYRTLSLNWLTHEKLENENPSKRGFLKQYLGKVEFEIENLEIGFIGPPGPNS